MKRHNPLIHDLDGARKHLVALLNNGSDNQNQDLVDFCHSLIATAKHWKKNHDDAVTKKTAISKRYADLLRARFKIKQG